MYYRTISYSIIYWGKPIKDFSELLTLIKVLVRNHIDACEFYGKASLAKS